VWLRPQLARLGGVSEQLEVFRIALPDHVERRRRELRSAAAAARVANLQGRLDGELGHHVRPILLDRLDLADVVDDQLAAGIAHALPLGLRAGVLQVSGWRVKSLKDFDFSAARTAL
jgi:hypothetical protein